MSKAPKTTKAIRDFFLDEDPPRTAQAPRSAKSPKRQASRGPQKPSVPLLPADERYLCDRAVAVRFGVSRQTVGRWAKSRARFPKPVVISTGTTRWLLSDLMAYELELQEAPSRGYGSEGAV